MNRLPLLILDVDETLIFASGKKLERQYDFKVFDYYIYKRPRLEEFLYEMNEIYNLAIWSSAGDKYIETLIPLMTPKSIKFEFIWAESKAVYRRNYDLDEKRIYDNPNHYHYVKPLKKVRSKFKYPFEKMLIVDDSPYKCQLNYGNAIYPIPFKGSVDDVELVQLAKYLKYISTSDNFRKLEKRNWRNLVYNLD